MYIFVRDKRVIGSYEYEGEPPFLLLSGAGSLNVGGEPATAAMTYRDLHFAGAVVCIVVDPKDYRP